MKISNLNALIPAHPLVSNESQELKPIKTLVVMPNPEKFAGTTFKESELGTVRVNEDKQAEHRLTEAKAEKKHFHKMRENREELRRARRRGLESYLKARETYRDFEKDDAKAAVIREKLLQSMEAVVQENREAMKSSVQKFLEAHETLKKIVADIQLARKRDKADVAKLYAERREHTLETKEYVKTYHERVAKHVALMDEHNRESLIAERKTSALEGEKFRSFRKYVCKQSLDRLAQRRKVWDQTAIREKRENEVYEFSLARTRQTHYVYDEMESRLKIRREIASGKEVQLFGPSKNILTKRNHTLDAEANRKRLDFQTYRLNQARFHSRALHIRPHQTVHEHRHDSQIKNQSPPHKEKVQQHPIALHLKFDIKEQETLKKDLQKVRDKVFKHNQKLFVTVSPPSKQEVIPGINARKGVSTA